MRGRSTELWWGTAVEAPDPTSLAAFYSKLLDWPVVHEEPGQTILQATLRTPSTWSSSLPRTTCHRFGLPRRVISAVALGARVIDFQPQDNVRVLLDPAGHPFCLCRDDDT